MSWSGMVSFEVFHMSMTFLGPIHLLDLLWRDDDHRSVLNAGNDERGVGTAVSPFCGAERFVVS
jgi:hypothetical protein